SPMNAATSTTTPSTTGSHGWTQLAAQARPTAARQPVPPARPTSTTTRPAYPIIRSATIAVATSTGPPPGTAPRASMPALTASTATMATATALAAAPGNS